MTLPRGWALVALLLAAPLAACGQPPASGARNGPVDLRAPSAEAQALFEALRERPATSDAGLGLTPEQIARMDKAISGSSTLGEAVANWQNEGLSQRALLATRPGGAAAYMLEGTLPSGPFRIYPGDPPIDSLIPAQWVPVGRYGERRESAVIQVEIARLSPKVVEVSRIGIEEVGNATCYLHASTVFYADPAVPASQRDILELGFQLRAAPEIHRLAVCALWEERAPGAYDPRYFDRSGHRMPQLDAESRTFIILPRAPFPANAGTR